MTYKEWTAIVQLAAAIGVGIWLATDLGAGGGEDVAAVATRLLWAIGAAILLSILGNILVVILASILQGSAVRDEADDERDRSVAARALRNSALVQSLAAVAGLFLLAFGGDPALGAYGLFVAPFLGGTVDAGSRLFYYRAG